MTRHSRGSLFVLLTLAFALAHVEHRASASEPLITNSETMTFDSIFLKNGALYRGRIIEIVPEDHVTILTASSTPEEKRIEWSALERVVLGGAGSRSGSTSESGAGAASATSARPPSESSSPPASPSAASTKPSQLTSPLNTLGMVVGGVLGALGAGTLAVGGTMTAFGIRDINKDCPQARRLTTSATLVSFCNNAYAMRDRGLLIGTIGLGLAITGVVLSSSHEPSQLHNDDQDPYLDQRDVCPAPAPITIRAGQLWTGRHQRRGLRLRDLARTTRSNPRNSAIWMRMGGRHPWCSSPCNMRDINGIQRRDTYSGLGVSTEAPPPSGIADVHAFVEERSPLSMTCPPPSGERTPHKRHHSEVVRGVGAAARQETLRRYESGAAVIDISDLAAVVRVTKTTIARPNRSTNVSLAPLDPREAFVLSRIDGSVTVEDVADLVGLPVGDAVVIVRRMLELELVEV